MDGEGVDGLSHARKQPVGRGQDRHVGWRELSRLRHHATAILGDHRQRALREIAEIVGEVCVDALDDAFAAVIAVLAERHFAQQEIAELIDAVIADEDEGIDHVADRLRHLLPAIVEKAVAEHALRQCNVPPTSGRQANRRRESG